MTSIDLNADLGEGSAVDEALLAIVTSCNVACGGHAGDIASMRKTVDAAIGHCVSIGAHPSYPDREGFGRRSHFLAGDALYESLASQIGMLDSIARGRGVTLAHVKPHGALYSDAAEDAALAAIVARAAASISPAPAIVGLPGSELARAAEEKGLDFITEGFMDRAYDADGRLVPRSQPGAVHGDRETMLAQAISLASGGRVDTLCVHSDTRDAAAAAGEVRAALEAKGIEVRAVGR